MADESAIDEIPSEMKEKLVAFNSALTDLETTLDPLISCPHSVLSERVQIFIYLFVCRHMSWYDNQSHGHGENDKNSVCDGIR